MSSVEKEILNILDEFMARVYPDVIGSVIVRRDGLPIASRMTGEFNIKLVGAMIAIAKNTVERLGAELTIGEPIITIMQYSKNSLLMVPLSKDLVLTAITKQEPNLGLIMLEIDRIRGRLVKVLSE
ncbi:roadblock/LC7 domain-containing protein [Vulcanisaeta thermophila]|uniref:roadblock/LC7 domain-containing protein n=1 Tax=Vulcanisaeta thermophila TaxID=867917 RepID=UPI000852B0B7|nr:dynein regulation protein LC7 [Vulcanisaeta thermophila]